MEKLLNKLIDKGWKPFGAEANGVRESWFETIREFVFDYKPMFCIGGIWEYQKVCLRQIVSKESGLWQFVCENKMEKKMEKINRGIWINSWHKDAYESYPVYTMEKYEYWILESALCDEDKLEKFLLDNIKLD